MRTFNIYSTGLCEWWVVSIEGEVGEAMGVYRTKNVNVNGRWSGHAIWQYM